MGFFSGNTGRLFLKQRHGGLPLARYHWRNWLASE